MEPASSASAAQESLSPIAQERHLDSLVCQFERFLCGQKLSNLETVELQWWFEEAKYADLELVVVHSCEVWASQAHKSIVGDVICRNSLSMFLRGLGVTPCMSSRVCYLGETLSLSLPISRVTPCRGGFGTENRYISTAEKARADYYCPIWKQFRVQFSPANPTGR